MELSEGKKRFVKLFMDKGVLLSPEFVEQLSSASDEDVGKVITRLSNENSPLIMSKEVEEFFSKVGGDTDWGEFERMVVNLEKKKGKEMFGKVVEVIKEDTEREKEKNKKKSVEVLFSYEDSDSKKDVQTFVSYFNNRYSALKKILQNRQELERASAISRVKVKTEKETVAVIGIVSAKILTKNKNIILTIEDPSGEINVLVNNSKPELISLTKSIVLDEVIGVTGTSSNGIIFVNSIVFPDIPLSHEMKRSNKDESLAVIGDIHLGSKHFLYDEFMRMIKWLRGEFGSEMHKEEAAKIKYVFLIGDLVDGVGIYPSQENDLEIKDIKKQYDVLANYLKMIPEHMEIIICAGNHDAVRIAEPQPPLPKDFAKSLWDLPNVTMVSNPSVISLGADENFSGFNVLLYHGFSFPYYGEGVESLRLKGGLESVEHILEFLLKKRHLAPTHTSTQYIPDEREDFLVIKHVPDIFITGHIHRTSITNYKGVTMMNSSSWIGMTDFQEKVGLKPLPARVPIINLKTRKAKILKFSND